MTAAPLGCLTLARVVDQDLAHEAGGDSVEVGSILPFDFGSAGQTEEGFVHQGGGLQRVIAAFVAHAAARNAVQFIVSGGDEAR